MPSGRTELTCAEKAYRFVCQAIPPLLGSGQVSRSAGLWLLGIFLFMLVVAGISAYLGQASCQDGRNSASVE